MVKKMTGNNEIYNLGKSIIGWPVEDATSLQEASEMILGSPYWNIPEDSYIVLDQNETYSLLGVYFQGRVSTKKRYLAVNMDFLENSSKIEMDNE